jgi:hypothetical protein
MRHRTDTHHFSRLQLHLFAHLIVPMYSLKCEQNFTNFQEFSTLKKSGERTNPALKDHRELQRENKLTKMLEVQLKVCKRYRMTIKIDFWGPTPPRIFRAPQCAMSLLFLRGHFDRCAD